MKRLILPAFLRTAFATDWVPICRGLGTIYQDMLCAPSIQKLTEAEYLVPVEYYAPSKPDLDGLKIRAGDYVEEGLITRMDKPQLIGDIVEKQLQSADVIILNKCDLLERKWTETLRISLVQRNLKAEVVESEFGKVAFNYLFAAVDENLVSPNPDAACTAAWACARARARRQCARRGHSRGV